MEPPTVQFKSNYAVERRIEAFYKGGRVQINKDGTHLFCTCGNKVNILEIATGVIVRSIEQVMHGNIHNHNTGEVTYR
ncbi:hypothetical protein AB205_0148650 [Aquarana catesbeiana]|uniref:Uncharacterized protein n=1 Tax=Aquarana catesbeiana TaxID=8400 RepID=A0A2G9QKZ2_AQUCT|nr:hypothetical protein AB205_0148650 [Aquarana catesbeiana]